MSEQQPVDTTVLTHLFEHHTWANLRLLDFCAGLSDEQLAASAVGGYGSLRATLAHLVSAETDYVCRVTGAAFPDWMAERRWPGFDGLRAAAAASGEALGQLARRAGADDTVRETDAEQGQWVEYPLSWLLVQAINHATEHRAQVAAIITQFGLEPPVMDGWTAMEARGAFREGAL